MSVTVMEVVAHPHLIINSNPSSAMSSLRSICTPAVNRVNRFVCVTISYYLVSINPSLAN